MISQKHNPRTVLRSIDVVQEEIIEGLFAVQPYISPRFFYDQKGSELFNQITQLEEYYPTRTELSILEKYRAEIGLLMTGKSVIELGSGDSTKISQIFDTLSLNEINNMAYCPVDVSRKALNDTVQVIHKRYPGLAVQGIVADFVHHMEEIQVAGKKVFCFFGSTLGNFEDGHALQLLRSIRSRMNEGDYLFLGLDRVKDQSILEAAYNDRKGVTAQFNLNILQHINSLIQSDFDLNAFKHKAIYNPDKERVEMYLIATKNQTINSPLFSIPLVIQQGKEIHTENSHKYSILKIQSLIAASDLQVDQTYTDENEWFSLLCLRP